MRRLVPILTAIATVVCLAVVPATSAAASPPAPRVGARALYELRVTSTGIKAIALSQGQAGTTLCLTNTSRPPMCAMWDSATITQVVIGALTLAATVYGIIISSRGGGGKHEKAVDDGETNNGDWDTDAGLCLQSTGGFLNYAACGDNGTYWIEETHNNGIALQNQYLLDNNSEHKYITTAGNAAGDHLYLHDLCSGCWQTWTWEFATVGFCTPSVCT